jgi:hypothetical protein
MIVGVTFSAAARRMCLAVSMPPVKHLGDVGVRDEGGADARPEAGHHVDHAGRHEVGGAAHELDDARGGELGQRARRCCRSRARARA